MDYDKMCQSVLGLDSQIRFVGVANTRGELVTHMYQKGITEFFSENDLKMSLHYSMQAWEKSTNLHHKIGSQNASVVEYEKVTLISIPVSNSEMFVASVEPGVDYYQMILKIKPLLE